MEDLLMCSVCIERYNESKRQPVLLPRCGHSFCRPCVSILISGGCIVCPTCRTDQRIDFVERLPTEYTLLAIINAQENSKKETCERHCVKLSFWCRSCQIATCGECLFEDHPTHSHDVIRATKYIENMKAHAQSVAIKFIEVLDEREQSYYKTIFNCTRKISSAIQNIGALRKDMEEARGLMKGIKEDESISAATSLSEAAKFLGLKWNIQDANFQRQVQEEIFRDEIDIEKERAQKEAAAKEEEEKKLKEKVVKEKKDTSKRVLRKSKTLSSMEAVKECKEDQSSEPDQKPAEPTKEQIVTKPEDAKPNIGDEQKQKPEADKILVLDKSKTQPKAENDKKEITNNEESNSKEAASNIDQPKGESKSDDLKTKESNKLDENSKPVERRLSKPELKSNIKDNSIKDDISIQDIIRMKEQLRRRDTICNLEDLKTKNEKLELATMKVRPKPKIKPFQKKVTSVPSQSADEKLEVGGLPPVQEKESEGKVQQTSNDNESLDVSGTPGLPVSQVSVKKEVDSEIQEVDSKDVSDDEEDSDNGECDKNTLTELVEKTPSEDPINSNSGLSEDSKTKSKEMIDDTTPLEEGKLMDYIQVPGFMIAVEGSDGTLGALEWGPQGLHVHCLQFTHVTYDIVIRDTVLNSIIPSKSPTVFLELTADQTILGRVYIQLWGHLRRAHNFLSLCLGDHGKSYLNTKFLQVYNIGSPGERILGGDYESNTGRGGRGLFDDLEWNGDYAMQMKAGMITAAGTGTPTNNSLFLVCTQSDSSRNFSCPFGIVYEGLKVMKEAIQQTTMTQVWISDCGVVIVPPKLDSLVV